MIDYFKKKEIIERAEDEMLFEYVMDEMEETEPIKGLWAKAIAHSEGNNDKAKSMYMQFRVQSIKDEFDALKILYNEMSKEKLFETIKNGFKEQHEKFETIKAEEVKKEEEKYNKIGGWLIVFTFFLIIGALSTISRIMEYFSDDFKNNLELLYINNQVDVIDTINKIAYLDSFGIFITILLLLSFFGRVYIARTVVILFFLSKLIIVPLGIYLIYGVNPELATSPDSIKSIGSLFWALILLPYFIFSKRVKKTFTNGKKKDDSITALIILPAVIAGLFLVIFNENQPTHRDIQSKIERMADKSFEEKDYNTAIKWYKNLLDRGNNSAAFRLAYSFTKIGDSKNRLNDKEYYDNAIKYYLQYIEKEKYEGAMWNLALLYKEKEDYENAQKWFKEAFDIYLKKARNGGKEAMKSVAYMYKYGEGTKKDLTKSKYWENKEND